MKKCPQCNRTYADETLSFCLEDGALLSASFNAQETAAPTVAISVGEVQTVAAAEIPTIVARKPENTAASFQQTNGAGWIIYLTGLFISLVVELVNIYLLFPMYVRATPNIYSSIANKFDNATIGQSVVLLIVMTPFGLFVYSLLAFALAFIWWRGKWKWGIIATIPTWAFNLYYFVIFVSYGYASPAVYIKYIVVNILYTIFACLFAAVGSLIGRKFFNKNKV